MTELDSHTIAVLERASQPVEHAPDWSEVLDRAGEPARSRRRLWVRLAVPVAVAAAALVAVLAWPLHGPSSVITQALAAVGNRPMLHMVFEENAGTVVNLRTGTRVLVHGRREIWYDPAHGLVQRSTFGRSTALTFFATKQIVGFSGYARTFVTGYRDALRSGEFHVTRSGTLDGKAVYWIESTASQTYALTGSGQTVVQQIAISRTTFKPLLTRVLSGGRVQPGSIVRVLRVESLAARPALFAHLARSTARVAMLITSSSPETTLAQARAAMRAQPVVPPSHIGGLRRTRISEPRYLGGRDMSRLAQLAGVELFYGRLDGTGHPLYRGRYISITEFPRVNQAVLLSGRLSFPTGGNAVLVGRRATLRAHGLYIIVEASSAAGALEAARALVRP